MIAWKFLISIISLIINVGLIYFALRLLLIFKGGKMKKPWLYISLGALALAASSSFFLLFYFLSLPEAYRPIGGIIMLIGGGLILIGLYTQYQSWTRV
jgi:hypothetical protein